MLTELESKAALGLIREAPGSFHRAFITQIVALRNSNKYSGNLGKDKCKLQALSD